MSENADSEINDQYIRLEDFLKFRGIVDSGGQAKVKIQGGEVTVNGEVETRRARKLRAGDKVQLKGAEPVTVDMDETAPIRRTKK